MACVVAGIILMGAMSRCPVHVIVSQDLGIGYFKVHCLRFGSYEMWHFRGRYALETTYLSVTSDIYIYSWCQSLNIPGNSKYKIYFQRELSSTAILRKYLPTTQTLLFAAGWTISQQKTMHNPVNSSSCWETCSLTLTVFLSRRWMNILFTLENLNLGIWLWWELSLSLR